MKLHDVIVAILLLFSTLHAHTTSASATWMTQYQTKNTLTECSLGKEQFHPLLHTFSVSDHLLFFHALDQLMVVAPTATLSDTSMSYENREQKILDAFYHLTHSIEKFYKKHPTSTIAHLLKSWSTLEFSKTEKETLSYFEHLQHAPCVEDLTPLQQALYKMTLHADTMKARFHSHLSQFSHFYQQYGVFLIDLYTHQKMLSLLDHTFDPLLFHHIETYLEIAHKKAVFGFHDALVHQFFNGTILVTTSSEREAKKLLKPLFNKFARRCCASDETMLSTAARKNFYFSPLSLNLAHDKRDEKT